MLGLKIPGTNWSKFLAGAILEVTTFYEDGTLSRDVLSIPVTRENILPRAYYHLQYGYDGSYFTQDVACKK